MNSSCARWINCCGAISIPTCLRQRLGQAGVLARLGQHGAAGPGGVVLELHGHRLERLVGAGDLVLGEQLANTGHIRVHIGQCLLDFALGGLQQRLVAQLLLVALARQRGGGRASRYQADVTLEAIQRLGAALGHGLVGEQTVEATEDRLGSIAPGQQIPLVELAAFDVLLGRADHDLQVLAHVGIALGGQLRLQRGARLAHGIAIARGVVRTEVDDLIVVAGHAEEAGVFGLERRLRIEQDLRIAVAGLHPGRAGGYLGNALAGLRLERQTGA